MAPSRFKTAVFFFCVLFIFLQIPWVFTRTSHATLRFPGPQPPAHLQQGGLTAWQQHAAHIVEGARSIINDPIESPYKSKFQILGERVRLYQEWVRFLDDAPESDDKKFLWETVESAIMSSFPFLRAKQPDGKTPFTELRSTIVKGSRGIVIPAGKRTLRFAAHLIGALREILPTELPIQVAYAGDEDLPPHDRERLGQRFTDVQFLDIFTAVDDTTLSLAESGWAIKAFAALYAPFEEVILLDADCVFLQVPEKLFVDPSYILTGVLLFHDRLLWQHGMPERHDWWRSQIHEPSAALNKSLVWTEDYAEEEDSGVVVVNKSRLDVLMGLLHVAWQNMQDVREEVTYKLTYGDKESWWLGFELSGTSYAFEKHYGVMVGWFKGMVESSMFERICSFVIGHVDISDELIWYNGGLLKNKRVDMHEFGLPTRIMIDGTWEKGSDGTKMSCMIGRTSKPLSQAATRILNTSITLAHRLDDEFGFV
jgi:alpha 1,3-mannosyltransferase